jgi:hypothetical protein
MSYKAFGLFIPTECDQSEIDVLTGTISGRATPTECNEQKSVLAPYAEQANNAKGFLDIECMAGYTNDIDNYPADRSQISSEVKNAINSTHMTIGIRSDATAKAINNDRGNALIQECRGMYGDFSSRASFVWNLNDPTVTSDPADNNYMGKSRPPVMDFLDNALFYDTDGETQFVNVYYPSIYSDGDFVYAVAVVSEHNVVINGGSVMLFMFDPWKRIFIKRSIINEVRGEFLIDATLTSVFAPIAGPNVVPMSPVICRIKNFMNKMVCVFMGVRVALKDTPVIFVYESYDDGLTWIMNTGMAYDGFYEYISGNMVSDFRIRIASNGQDIVIMWGYTPSPLTTSDGQIRLICSKDGCTTWEYGNSNIARSFMANSTDINDVVDSPSASVVVPYSIKFGLTVDSDGRFVAAKCGEGEYITPSGSIVSAMASLVFVIIEGTSVIYNQVVQISHMNPVQYEPWNVDYLRLIYEVALFSDPVQREDYAVIKLKAVSGTYSSFLDMSFFNVIVRFKIMPNTEWTVSPDWISIATAAKAPYAEYITFIEPLNRNNVWHASVGSSGTNSNHFAIWHGIVHRGNILICGVGGTVNLDYPFIGGFKSWTNVPVQYPVRQTIHPLIGDLPTYYGMPRVNSGGGAAVTYTNMQSSNLNRYSMAAGSAWLAGDGAYHLYSYIPLNTTDLRGAPLGVQENVIRVVVMKQNVPAAAGNVRIFECRTPVWDTATSAWIMSSPRIYARSDRFRLSINAAITSLDFLASDSVYYEIMMISKTEGTNTSWSAWYREYNNQNNTKIVQRWTLIGSEDIVTPNIVGNWTPGVAVLLRFGVVYVNNNFNVGASDMVIGFKSIATSKSHSDIYPEFCASESGGGIVNWNAYISRLTNNHNPSGVLSSEYYWFFDDPSVAGNMRKSVRGEFISPEPNWVGEEWLVSKVVSNYSKRGALVWLNLDSTFTHDLLSVYLMTPNEGNLSLRYRQNGAGLFYSDFLMGASPGGGATSPSLATPAGMSFNGTQYLREFGGISNTSSLINGFTVSFWMRRTNAANTGYVIYKRPASGGVTGWAVRLNGVANTLQFYSNGVTSSSPAVFTAADLNRWVFVVITYNNKGIRWYKNGVEIGISTAVTAISATANNVYMYIGSDGGANGYVGDLCKVAVFNRILSGKELVDLFSEGVCGPAVPSDFFVRIFGDYGVFGDTWRLLPKNAGGAAENTLNGMVGFKYFSDRGKYPAVHNLGTYGDGDVEIILYQKDEMSNASYITANAVLIMGCNATDVVIYHQDADPTVVGIGGGVLEDFGVFKYADSEYGIPEFIYKHTSDAFPAAGVIQRRSTDPQWRPNVYVGERINSIYSPGSLNWFAAADINSFIGTCITNDEDKIVLDSNEIDPTYTGGTTYVYQMSDSLLVVFPRAVTARYWRLVFGNNALNGEKIEVGMVRLGTIEQFDSNPDTPFSVTRRIVEKDLKAVPGVGAVVPYLKRIKSDFNISMALEDARSDGSDFHKLINAYKNAVAGRDGVFLVLSNDDGGFINATNRYFPLVFRCAPDGDMVVQNTRMGFKDISIKLKEM